MPKINVCLTQPIVGAGSPAKKAARSMAPASPVFAGEPAPTGGMRHSAHSKQFLTPINRP
ncbi:hypothetical protein DZA28_23045 [Pseudomonas alloputida]|uniref:Uncharacterized protein n=1 Tax=Pseudomonas alloputida TaxID=1940621 RepID=A0ABY3DAD4_9PSED|nr:hypothetical protein DK184_20540 [Pseudomonas sp. RW405]TRZ62656.1 hypothetical protein DZA28_23045 [Pseudomonas alloputida]HBK50835.1 hypothetical protein [Pseudomonas sp.]